MSSDRIPLSAPHLAGAEWAYVKECLDTGWVSSAGSFVDCFEADFARAVGARAAVACASGTAALHVALLLAGVGQADEVLVSDLTFIAPANAVRYLGAWPTLIDAEPEYMQMDVAAAASFLEEGCKRDGAALINLATGRRVAAVLPVHVVGHPCDMDPLLEAARRHGLPVIEDATESLGSRYRGRPTGSLADLGCFSFNGNKIITTGSGGMIVTDDVALAKRARHLTTQAKRDPLEFVHDEIGFNYRLSNIQAAMGVAQLEQLDAFVAAKRRIGAAYDAAFADLEEVTVPRDADWATSNRWLYTIRLDESRALMRDLGEHGIESRPLWQPMHESPAHAGAFAWNCRVSTALNRQALSIPCSVGLTTDQQARVIERVRAFVRTRHPSESR